MTMRVSLTFHGRKLWTAPRSGVEPHDGLLARTRLNDAAPGVTPAHALYFGERVRLFSSGNARPSNIELTDHAHFRQMSDPPRKSEGERCMNGLLVARKNLIAALPSDVPERREWLFFRVCFRIERELGSPSNERRMRAGNIAVEAREILEV